MSILTTFPFAQNPCASFQTQTPTSYEPRKENLQTYDQALEIRTKILVRLYYCLNLHGYSGHSGHDVAPNYKNHH